MNKQLNASFAGVNYKRSVEEKEWSGREKWLKYLAWSGIAFHVIALLAIAYWLVLANQFITANI